MSCRQRNADRIETLKTVPSWPDAALAQPPNSPVRRVATLIPVVGSCVSRMTIGEKRFAWRSEDKLEDDYLCWYDVSIGERTRHPDFVVFHPSRGLLVLEVKDCKLGTLLSIDKQQASVPVNDELKRVANPLEQTRQRLICHKF